MRPVTPGEPPAKDTKKPQGKVLLVEDERDNVMVAQIQLRRRYEVRVAMTDEEACRHLCEAADELDAVLMDVQLRGSVLDGFQLARAMRGELPTELLPPFARALPEACRDIPVLFVTAFAHADGFDFDSISNSSVVGKPINFSELNLQLTQLYLSGIGS